MKKIFVATLAVAALLLAGCAKNEQNAPQGRIVRVSAGADELISKVSSSTSGRFTWRSAMPRRQTSSDMVYLVR